MMAASDKIPDPAVRPPAAAGSAPSVTVATADPVAVTADASTRPPSGDAGPVAAVPDVVLIGCTKAKRSERAAARDLYDVSDLFRRRRAYAERSGVRWAVLSARHGLVLPERELDPYDFTIRQRLRVEHRPAAWARFVLQSCFFLAGRTASFDPEVGYAKFVEPLTVEIHAGVDYVRAVELGVDAFRAGITLLHPVAGMGIGEQKAWYFGRQLALEGVGS